jgi:predicted subunit of tRNA(5-methylaminomethyl-2-thiouridylate) methyltransferase
MDKIETIRFIFPISPPGHPGRAVTHIHDGECQVTVADTYVILTSGTHHVRVPMGNVAHIAYQREAVADVRPQRGAGTARRA